MVSPQQQELELKKSEQGKESPVIDKILDDDDQGSEEEESPEDDINNIKALAGLTK